MARIMAPCAVSWMLVASTCSSVYVSARDTLNGYRVVNQVRLTVREIKRLGEVLDAAVTQLTLAVLFIHRR